MQKQCSSVSLPPIVEEMHCSSHDMVQPFIIEWRCTALLITCRCLSMRRCTALLITCRCLPLRRCTALLITCRCLSMRRCTDLLITCHCLPLRRCTALLITCRCLSMRRCTDLLITCRCLPLRRCTALLITCRCLPLRRCSALLITCLCQPMRRCTALLITCRCLSMRRCIATTLSDSVACFHCEGSASHLPWDLVIPTPSSSVSLIMLSPLCCMEYFTKDTLEAMLIKEYRISLPMSAEEYRIGQLYMIQKKSRVESHGAGSGVEILKNEPYENGPGGRGQYTHKVYHIGSHIPGWFRAILPKSALLVEEEAWNAYPYTKTRYKCPFVEKFVLEIETKYLNDGGEQENIFNLSPAELKERVLDIIDIVKEPISGGDYKQEEDPKLYQSIKTKRGPLNDNWMEEYRRAIKDPNNKTISLMTAYKLCRVEFKYWGMQTKIERFIHDIALRKTMLRAHRQAWCWQDEYYGLQLSDIRRLERETELALREKMADVSFEDETDSKNKKYASQDNIATHDSHIDSMPKSSAIDSPSGTKYFGDKMPSSTSLSKCSPSHQNPGLKTSETSGKERAMSLKESGSKSLSNWRVQSLMHLQEASSDEEFYDAPVETLPVRSSSMECLSVSADEFVDAKSTLSSCTDLSTEPYTGRRLEKLCQKYSLDLLPNTEKNPPKTLDSQNKVLFLVIHGGSLLDTAEHVNTSKRSDFSTLKTTFSTVMKAHYPAAIGQIVFKLVPCPQICTDALNILSSLAPFGFDTTPVTTDSNLPWTMEYIPLGTVALFSTSSADYKDHINTMVAKANLVYQEFLNSSEGKGFNGKICILGDSVGSLLAYDALCRSGSHLGGSHSSLLEQEFFQSQEGQIESESFQSASDCSPQHKGSDPNKHVSDVIGISLQGTCDSHAEEAVLRHPHKTHISERLYVGCNDELQRCSGSGSGSSYESFKFDFDVTDFFMFGSSLGIVLAQRRLNGDEDKTCPPQRPACHQVFNLFHSSDPTAVRIEPLIDFSFKHIPPVHVPRYTRFPMGDAESVHLVDAIFNHLHLFSEHMRSSISPQSLPLRRHTSVTSTSSDISIVEGNAVVSIANVSSKWWGSKRIDCVLYSPEVLHSFPIPALPPLFHASFWESTDVAAFIIRQVLRPDSIYGEMAYSTEKSPERSQTVQDNHPKEKWQKRRTLYKVKNLQANHRGNDVLASEDKPQVLQSRFTYGPLDMTYLSGEKIDVHVMDTLGEWNYMGTEVTDGNGRVLFTIPEDKKLSHGIYPVKMVVRVDHTFADLFLAVLPPKTETVVFSVDGSFTASVSIMGKDPKVRAGAVDVVRYWQELGYLILYITARPDMQHRQVVSWLAQHNFPHGMVIFMDGFSKEPLRQKINYLRNLQQDVQLVYRAAYGSSKDISGYKDLGLKKEQIFIVGKASKKQASHAMFVASGYAAHLETLTGQGVARPVSGNAKLIIRKNCFSLPTHLENKRSSKRTSGDSQSGVIEGATIPGFTRQESTVGNTVITVSELGHTIIQSGQCSLGLAARSRGVSPRPKMHFESPR
ncbi:hypothetical protein CHS0354_003237 [Potamilus streckersoni]|uniref:DDHD domain-containing protein n=1 Tax=Potamilus streckersoni TaxID=2493646 RepID=A0AAE0RYB8_9BIVA|nr:hypothetical protein CHS0354_003237 [Potamilus streckersoni]